MGVFMGMVFWIKWILMLHTDEKTIFPRGLFFSWRNLVCWLLVATSYIHRNAASELRLEDIYVHLSWEWEMNE
jgi:hypothetical protein